MCELMQLFASTANQHVAPAVSKGFDFLLYSITCEKNQGGLQSSLSLAVVNNHR